jgi:hypothetical protein
MTTGDDTKVEVLRLRRLLKGIADIAESASISGSLAGGAASGVRKYNAVLQRLEAIGVVVPGMFQPLAEGVSFDEVGVESGLLASYLKDAERDEGYGEGNTSTSASNSFVVSLGGMKDMKELNELRDLGKVIREQLPGWVRGHVWTEGVETTVRSESGPSSLSEVESRLSEVGAQLQMVAEQLRRTDIGDALRAELGEQLSRLGQEQARLARKRAVLRERQAG